MDDSLSSFRSERISHFSYSCVFIDKLRAGLPADHRDVTLFSMVTQIYFLACECFDQ